MAVTKDIPSFPRYLFWDIDMEQFDVDYSYQLVIERIIKMGTLPVWRSAQAYFGRNKFIEVANYSKQLTEHEKKFTYLFTKSSYHAVPERRGNSAKDVATFTPA